MSTTVPGRSGAPEPTKQRPPVIDYEGSPYRTEFWEGAERAYEDATERLALQALVPSAGRRIAELGAGFGRLADLYQGYEQIILFDYSRTMLADAVARWGHDPRFVFIAGNVYDLPLAKASLDTLVMVRVMHHLADVPKALRQIHRVLHNRSVAVVEYANKRNLKAIARWLLGRQQWSPMDTEPVEFVKLNFDFHPAWMWEQLQSARFVVRKQYAVSHFRLASLKRMASPDFLARLDRAFFAAGGRYPLAPSVFVQLAAPGADSSTFGSIDTEDVTGLFACPSCASEQTFAYVRMDLVECQACGARHAQRDGIWDFKETVD